MKHLIIIMAVLLSGCASYSETTQSQQLGANVHRVSMRGNALNSSTDAQDYALLKAAEITIDSGNRYFVITNSQDKTRRTSYTKPGTSTSTTYGSATANTTADIYGNQYYGTTNVKGTATTNTTYRPGQTTNYVHPGVDMMIETYADKPNTSHFDATEIIKYLGSKYNPKRWGKTGETGNKNKALMRVLLGM
ncbi:MAG: hypothetical protein COB36_11485 [Alphaproteobacteria bacterium]|nr:MAG: hypothetical protein COB36_11485 [Alphaproteobacteria bacterium]